MYLADKIDIEPVAPPLWVIIALIAAVILVAIATTAFMLRPSPFPPHDHTLPESSTDTAEIMCRLRSDYENLAHAKDTHRWRYRTYATWLQNTLQELDTTNDVPAERYETIYHQWRKWRRLD